MNSPKPAGTSSAHRGFFLLPNAITLMALFGGFYSIVAAMHHLFAKAAISILISLVLDAMDGRVARLTSAESPFGAQLDSLSDMVCSGMAPALLIYTWALYPLGKVGWLAAFAYSACTALRLARFNLESVQDKRFFYGLPTPAAAGILATWVWLNPTNLWLHQHPWLLALAAVTLGGLKVSTFPFHSFKTLKIHDSVPFIMILAVMALFLLIIYKPPLMLLLLFVLYACHGPILYLFLLLKKRSEKTTKADTRP